jgi:hypothetical protein
MLSRDNTCVPYVGLVKRPTAAQKPMTAAEEMRNETVDCDLRSNSAISVAKSNVRRSEMQSTESSGAVGWMLRGVESTF